MGKLILIDMEQDLYKKTKKYWEDHASNTGEFSGFKIVDEPTGQYRLEKEFLILNRVMIDFTSGFTSRLKILDIGCARGHFIEMFLKYGDVTGIDFAQNYVELCQKKFADNPRVHILRGDILNLDLLDKFDVIFVGGVLPYIREEDLSKSVTNLSRLLKDHGIIIFRETTMSRKSIVTYEGGEYSMPCFRRKVDDLCVIFKANNLNINEIIPNLACTYTTLISKYRRIFPFKINFFNNKLIEFIFLFLPYKIFLFLRKNMFTYHFIIVKK